MALLGRLMILAAAVVAVYAAGKWFRKVVLIPKLTVLDDIPKLGEDRKGTKLPGQAVVCGGSIAGLLSAAVLSRHYEKVLIVEPEGWVATDAGVTLSEKREARPSEEGHPIEVNRRTRVMQATSLHIFLSGLLPIIRGLFPNFQKEADALGLADSIGSSDIDWRVSGIPTLPRPKWQETPQNMWLTRNAFETLIRRLLRNSRPNIRWKTGTVIGVNRKSDSSDLVESVVVRAASGSEGAEGAALVVDATGPAHAGLKWLEKIGLKLPPQFRAQYSPNMYYVTLMFSITPHVQGLLPIPGGWKNHVQPGKCHWVYGFINDPEVETSSVSLGILNHSQLVIYFGGWGTVDRPSSPGEVKDRMADLVALEPIPKWVFDIMDVLQAHIDELNPTIAKVTFATSTYIQYHEFSKTPRFPSNFVAVGDAVMKINPIYGQGSTKAAIGAVTLDHVLRTLEPSKNKNFASIFFQRQRDRINGSWDLLKASDYAFKTTVPSEGETLATGAFSRWFGKYLVIASLTDPVLTWIIWDVRGFLLPPTDLFVPSVLAKVLWTWLKGQLSSPAKAHVT